MRYKLTFAVGFAAGYVLGAKAGTERYQQIENAWRRFVDTPAVQEAAGVIGAQTGQVIDKAKQQVTERVSGTIGSRLHHGSRTSRPADDLDGATSATAGVPAEAAYPGRRFGPTS